MGFWIKPAVFVAVLMSVHTANATGGKEMLGIGPITNKSTRASESFKLYEILGSLELRNGSDNKIGVAFADNPATCNYYITGEIDNYRVQHADALARNSRLLVINKQKRPISQYTTGYITVFNLQLWHNGKFVKKFSDSLIHIPYEPEYLKWSEACWYEREMYDQGFAIYSALFLRLFNEFNSVFAIKTSKLKNGKLFSFDIKAREKGEELVLTKFLPSRQPPVIYDFNTKSFNQFFEHQYTTIRSKELHFANTSSSHELNQLIAQLSYPKTTWGSASESYLVLADKYLAEGDYEAFSLASWSALILTTEMKNKISLLLATRKRALQNLLKYSAHVGEKSYPALLQLHIDLIDGYLQAGYAAASEQKFDLLMTELQKTLADAQYAINNMIREEKSGKLLNTLSFIAAAGSTVNDGLKGLKSKSSTTTTLEQSHSALSRQNRGLAQQASDNFRERFVSLNVELPATFLQPEGENEIDNNRAFLYLECMKLVVADVDNKYWEIAMETFASNKPEIQHAYNQTKNVKGSKIRSEFSWLSRQISKYERQAFLTDKLKK